MDKKDQCESNNTCSINTDFNGGSCPNCESCTNDLSKSEESEKLNQQSNETSETVTDNIEYPDPNQSIKGWLTFFLFSIGLGGIISAIYPIATYNVAEYEGSHFLALSDVVIGVMLLALASYTIYSFVKRKPNSVFLGKMYVIIVLVTNVISLLGGELEETGFESSKGAIRGIFWGVIWLMYLIFSKQVQEIIPKSYRKVFNRDYYIIVAFVVISLLCIGLGVVEGVKSSYRSETEFISSSELAYNEYTDGIIIFAKPFGYTCEKQEIDDPEITLYVLDVENEATITICSDYDSDISASNFSSYWENWRDESLEDIRFREIVDAKRTINGNPCFIKTIEYQTEVPINWDFVLLFNKETDKVCVVSYYRIKERESCLEELLSSVRF